MSIQKRAGWVLTVAALGLALALGGCRGAGARNNSGAPVTQQSGGSSTTTSATGGSTSTMNSSSSSNNAALQQLETIDNQNQTDQQQLNSAQTSAGVNYSSQSNQIQP